MQVGLNLVFFDIPCSRHGKYYAIFGHVKCLLLLSGFTLRRIQPFSVLTLQIMQQRVSIQQCKIYTS